MTTQPKDPDASSTSRRMFFDLQFFLLGLFLLAIGIAGALSVAPSFPTLLAVGLGACGVTLAFRRTP